MGSYILSLSPMAKHPYRTKELGVDIYTAEELCYYIYHNFVVVDDDFISRELFEFLEDELKLGDHVAHERGVEEFLSGIGAKPSLVFTMEGDPIKNYSELTEDVGGEIVLQKNTWGYGDLYVSCSADYIELSTDHITSHDFVDDTYVFRYTIKADLLAQGLNVADILFTTAKGDKTFRVSITQQELTRFASRSDFLRKRSSFNLMQDFVAYRIAVSLKALAEQKRRLKSLYTSLKKLREETEDLSDRCGYGLMLIYVDMLRKHPEEADLLLDEVREPIMQNRLVNNRHWFVKLCL